MPRAQARRGMARSDRGEAWKGVARRSHSLRFALVAQPDIEVIVRPNKFNLLF